MLYAPGVPNAAEALEMSKLVDTYGKTWHTWQVDRGDTLPLGEQPQRPCNHAHASPIQTKRFGEHCLSHAELLPMHHLIEALAQGLWQSCTRVAAAVYATTWSVAHLWVQCFALHSIFATMLLDVPAWSLVACSSLSIINSQVQPDI